MVHVVWLGAGFLRHNLPCTCTNRDHILSGITLVFHISPPPTNQPGLYRHPRELGEFRCRALLPAEGMGDAHRNEVSLSSDHRAWEWLVEKSPLNPTSATSSAEASMERTARFGRDRSDGGPATIGDDILRYTTVPTAGEVDRVRSKLVVLRDAVLMPEHPPFDDTGSMFDNFDTKNSSRSNRWDAWQTLPPWSVYSIPACPLTEVRSRLGVVLISHLERFVDLQWLWMMA